MLLITPKVGDVKLVSGFANCGWFKCIEKFGTKLNAAFLDGANSTRTVFESARSRFACPGPSTIPVALSPNAVPMPSAPIIGGVVKQEALK